ncbi:hypothetical protein [Thalassotalea atypica]|uniref:hypothetical protein n=1 Tax=Thalassotalea atypica TaxID=2054316 RepID=UPI0025731878|nr:hypothetical protein [Thalassotalea atypica]
MSTRQIVERKERSMVEVLIIVVMIGVMASVFMNFFFKQEEHLNKAAFESLAQTFSAQVQIVHGQWLMDKQPRVVRLATLNDEQNSLITVNGAGWIDAEDSSTPCHDIWDLAMEIPLIFMNEPVSVIEIEHNNKIEERVCRYGSGENLSFDYHSRNGKVIM